MPPELREYILAKGRQAALNPCVADLATTGELHNAFVNNQPFWYVFYFPLRCSSKRVHQ